jgi:membrane protein implicated in regulation of membrane protease activity
MRDHDHVWRIDMSHIPVAGMGGLGLVAMALFTAFWLPAGRWMLLVGAAGGVLIAAALIGWRRFHRANRPDGDHPAILFQESPAAIEDARPADRPRPVERLVRAH